MNKRAQLNWGLSPKRKRTLTAADKKRIAAKQSWKCKRCKKPLPARYYIDHIKEFATGGSDRPSNLQALCANCHADKTEEDRYKKKQKKIREKEEREKHPFDFGLGSNRTSKSPFDFGLSKPRGRKKKKSPFDIF